MVINFPILVAILVLVYRRKRKQRKEKQETNTNSVGSETTLIENAASHMDPEAQEQEQNLRYSTGEHSTDEHSTDEQGNSVVIAVDVHPQLSTRLRRKNGKQLGPGSTQHGTSYSHHNSLPATIF